MFFKDKKLQYDPKLFEKEFNSKQNEFNSNSKKFWGNQNEFITKINEFIDRMLNKLLEIKTVSSNADAKNLIEKTIKIDPVLKIILAVAILLIFLSSPIFFIIWIIILIAIANNKNK